MSAQDTLAERYGRPSPWRRGLTLGLAAVVVLAFGGWLAWTIQDQSTPQVSSKLESFSVLDDHTVTAALIVTLADEEVRASCTLRAFAADHTTVGELTFTPDPSKGRRQVQTIRTERLATAVESLGCTAPGQERPR